MALAGKKTGTIHGKSGGNKAKLKAKFDDGALDILTDNPDDFPQNAAIIYAMQNITEDIDTLRTYTGTEIRSAVATNTAKNTNVTTNLSTTTSTTAVRVNSSDGTNATIPVATTSIGGVMSKAIFDQHTVNNSKVGTETDLSITEGITVKLTVTNNRGTYALVFTMVDSTGRTPVTKTATIALE